MNVKSFFTPEQQQRIAQSIVQAEKNTSGEIRVHLEKNCKGEVLDRAAQIFHQLKMDQTKLRNGVLFYLAVNDRKFAVLGDQGINNQVPEGFWNEIKERMLVMFHSGHFTDGVCLGVTKAGEKLKQYFPLQHNDKNELDNEISFEE
jgi:uncharacterized membrane protein